jgi:polyisoprenoid-binding protein YceI
MKKMYFPLMIAAVLILSAFTTYNNVSWKLAEGYSIAFESKNPAGIFKTMDGNIQFDPNNLAASSFDMKVDVASINTGNGVKNKHAISANWFDAAKYPHIKFKSSQITKTSKGYTITGLLDMHGIQKEITFPFTFQNDTFKGSFEVNRTNFKIGETTGSAANAATTLAVTLSVPVTK